MADFTKHSVTNTSDGPRVLNARTVLVLQPGETAEDAELNAAELASAKASGWFGFAGSKAASAEFDHDGDGKAGGSKPVEPPALSGKTKAELLEVAKAEGVEASEDLTVAEIKDAIEAKRAAA